MVVSHTVLVGQLGTSGGCILLNLLALIVGQLHVFDP